MLKLARQRVPGVAVLTNMVSKRVKQLSKGHRPLVKPLSTYEDKEDIALREIAEGKIVAEIDFSNADDDVLEERGLTIDDIEDEILS
ncbi:MAG: DNA-directed RNA polymerase subunit omega [Lentisphaerae bacterium]|nr:DNA-directed RNA polymerase subunit omega [Lentisphaerota bacterium]